MQNINLIFTQSYPIFNYLDDFSLLTSSTNFLNFQDVEITTVSKLNLIFDNELGAQLAYCFFSLEEYYFLLDVAVNFFEQTSFFPNFFYNFMLFSVNNIKFYLFYLDQYLITTEYLKIDLNIFSEEKFYYLFNKIIEILFIVHFSIMFLYMDILFLQFLVFFLKLIPIFFILLFCMLQLCYSVNLINVLISFLTFAITSSLLIVNFGAEYLGWCVLLIYGAAIPVLALFIIMLINIDVVQWLFFFDITKSILFIDLVKLVIICFFIATMYTCIFEINYTELLMSTHYFNNLSWNQIIFFQNLEKLLFCSFFFQNYASTYIFNYLLNLELVLFPYSSDIEAIAIFSFLVAFNELISLALLLLIATIVVLTIARPFEAPYTVLDTLYYSDGKFQKFWKVGLMRYVRTLSFEEWFINEGHYVTRILYCVNKYMVWYAMVLMDPWHSYTKNFKHKPKLLKFARTGAQKRGKPDETKRTDFPSEIWYTTEIIDWDYEFAREFSALCFWTLQDWANWQFMIAHYKAFRNNSNNYHLDKTTPPSELHVRTNYHSLIDESFFLSCYAPSTEADLGTYSSPDWEYRWNNKFRVPIGYTI